MRTRKVLKSAVIYSLLLAAGIIAGKALFSHNDHADLTEHRASESDVSTIWTCSMHPQIRMESPGKCPICGMDLIPLRQLKDSDVSSGVVTLGMEAQKLADVETSIVRKGAVSREIRLYGTVGFDERLVQSQAANVPGRIEKLYINYTGEPVRKGEVLAHIYSPELVVAQKELSEAFEMRDELPLVYDAAREKLRQMKLTEEQIDNMADSHELISGVDIFSTTTGVVTGKRVNSGDYVEAGTILYEVSDPSELWILFDAYEDDIRFLKKGDKITYELHAYPGERRDGVISFIDPVVDPVTHVAKVRVDVENPSGRLKPGMYARGVAVSIAGMSSRDLVIPRSAVLWTGTRSLVYISVKGAGDPSFQIREVTLGARAGDSYIVTGGLSEGEEVVSNGAFSVDAAAQLQGGMSMMNPGTDDQMDNMDMTSGPVNKEANVIHQHKEFIVSGNCEMCKDRIESTAMAVKGVKSAEWDINTKLFTVDFDGSITNTEAIRKAIAAAGHDNGDYKAPDEVYNNLPACCLYREKQ